MPDALRVMRVCFGLTASLYPGRIIYVAEPYHPGHREGEEVTPMSVSTAYVDPGMLPRVKVLAHSHRHRACSVQKQGLLQGYVQRTDAWCGACAAAVQGTHLPARGDAWPPPKDLHTRAHHVLMVDTVLASLSDMNCYPSSEGRGDESCGRRRGALNRGVNIIEERLSGVCAWPCPPLSLLTAPAATISSTAVIKYKQDRRIRWQPTTTMTIIQNKNNMMRQAQLSTHPHTSVCTFTFIGESRSRGREGRVSC